MILIIRNNEYLVGKNHDDIDFIFTSYSLAEKFLNKNGYYAITRVRYWTSSDTDQVFI